MFPIFGVNIKKSLKSPETAFQPSNLPLLLAWVDPRGIYMYIHSYCWWFRNPAITSWYAKTYRPLFTGRTRKNIPPDGFFGISRFLNHQQFFWKFERFSNNLSNSSTNGSHGNSEPRNHGSFKDQDRLSHVPGQCQKRRLPTSLGLGAILPTKPFCCGLPKK